MSKVKIAEAVGSADNGGRGLSAAIEAAMAQAVLDMNAMGIADDTPGERLAKILGPEWADKVGADAIRGAKTDARLRVRKEWAERDEAERQAAAEALAKEG